MAAVGVLLLVLGGVWMAAAVVLVICFALYEEFRALSMAGHRPVAWPTWVGVALSVPVLALDGDRLLIPIAVGVCLVTLTCVIFRAEPKLEDCLMSILPLMSLVLTGMCAMKLALIEPHVVQVCMLSAAHCHPLRGRYLCAFRGPHLQGPEALRGCEPQQDHFRRRRRPGG